MPDEMKMSPDQFAELRANVAAVKEQDVHLGRVLELLVLHLGHAHGLDTAAEDARLAHEARMKAREDEDASLKADAEALAASRAAEDAQPATPEQVAARNAARAEEDRQLQAAADERAHVRAEEDARDAASQSGEPAPAEEAPSPRSRRGAKAEESAPAQEPGA